MPKRVNHFEIGDRVLLYKVEHGVHPITPSTEVHPDTVGVVINIFRATGGMWVDVRLPNGNVRCGSVDWFTKENK